MSAPVISTQVGSVLVVTLNRPEVRNAVDSATATGIERAMVELDERDDLSVAVLTGAGGTFCAGMDLAAFLAGDRPSIPGRGFAGIAERPPAKPLIAAVEGYAIAGGFEIVLSCDLVVAANNAQFGLPEVKRGLLAGGGGLLRLPRRIPHHIAMEWILTGELVPAVAAERFGLVNRLVTAGTALATAVDLATDIATNGPLALRASKRIVTEAPDWPAAEAFNRQSEIYEPIRASDDAKEGARAFKEKRSPVWRGR
jgi:enoyl-CoA hydratase